MDTVAAETARMAGKDVWGGFLPGTPGISATLELAAGQKLPRTLAWPQGGGLTLPDLTAKEGAPSPPGADTYPSPAL